MKNNLFVQNIFHKLTLGNSENGLKIDFHGDPDRDIDSNDKILTVTFYTNSKVYNSDIKLKENDFDNLCNYFSNLKNNFFFDTDEEKDIYNKLKEIKRKIMNDNEDLFFAIYYDNNEEFKLRIVDFEDLNILFEHGISFKIIKSEYENEPVWKATTDNIIKMLIELMVDADEDSLPCDIEELELSIIDHSVAVSPSAQTAIEKIYADYIHKEKEECKNE